MLPRVNDSKSIVTESARTPVARPSVMAPQMTRTIVFLNASMSSPPTRRRTPYRTSHPRVSSLASGASHRQRRKPRRARGGGEDERIRLPLLPATGGAPALFRRDLATGAPGLRETDRDRLLPARDPPAGAARLERAALPFVHGVSDLLRGLFSVSRHDRPIPSGSDLGNPR